MQVEIWSDVVCPWCAIGKARFESALAELPNRDEVEVVWRSFELDPNAPRRRDGDYAALLAGKYGTSHAEAQAMIEHMTATAAGEGLVFDFTRVRPGNTFDAHRVLHLAADRGRQHEVKARFLAAYLGEGAAIGDHETLIGLAVEAGLDAAEVATLLGGDDYATAVRRDQQQALAYGIRGVPFFVIDGRYGISGAQPSEALRRALETADAERRTLTTIGAAGPQDGHEHRGAACTDGHCTI